MSTDDFSSIVAQRARETSAAGCSPCDLCGRPAAVIIRCAHHQFTSYRCAFHGWGVAERFIATGHPATVDVLVKQMTALPSSAWRLPAVESNT